MIEPDNPDLSITAQCRLLSISRSGYYYAPVPENGARLALMAVIDQVFMNCPWYGSRQMARHRSGWAMPLAAACTTPGSVANSDTVSRLGSWYRQGQLR
jgi:hypothetical protein